MHFQGVSAISTIEHQIRTLPLDEAEQLQDWLADYLEDQLEVSPEFVASIERGKADLKEGRSRRIEPK
ncbi:MAG: hypothetical protein ACI8UO_000713 [Verrucomicrobiales bacterium]|jgi:hypothetical protein